MIHHSVKSIRTKQKKAIKASKKVSIQKKYDGTYADIKTGIPSGKNLKPGSFGISEKGKKEAASNKKRYNSYGKGATANPSNMSGSTGP